MADFYEQWKNLSERINREVPIEEVLALYDIRPVSKGKYRLREDDDNPSASIFKAKNQIHDFGDNNSFSCCSFVAWYTGVSYKEATAHLAAVFGFEIPVQGKTEKSDKLSDWEWSKINIYGDMASKNMDFNPEKYGVERTAVYAERYRIPMDQLKTDDPYMYERIIRSRAISHVVGMRNDYFSSLYASYIMAKNVGVEESAIVDVLANKKELIDTTLELSQAEYALIKAIRDTSIKYRSYKYDVESDLHKVIDGKISFEIGPESHYDIKCAAHRDKAKVFYCLVSLDEYNKLLENGLEDIHFAAYQKGNEVNICFSSNDSGRVNYLVKALRGKEQDNLKNSEVPSYKENVTSEKAEVPSKGVASANEIEIN